MATTISDAITEYMRRIRQPRMKGNWKKMSPVSSPSDPHHTRIFSYRFRRRTVRQVVFHRQLFRFLNLLPIWFISFFSGNNWCVWSWRKSNIRTIDTCGYPGNIKRGTISYQHITNLLNPLRSLCDIRQQQALSIYPKFVQHVMSHPMWILPRWVQL